MHDSFKGLLPIIIPEGVSDYFENSLFFIENGAFFGEFSFLLKEILIIFLR